MTITHVNLENGSTCSRYLVVVEKGGAELARFEVSTEVDLEHALAVRLAAVFGAINLYLYDDLLLELASEGVVV